MASIHKYNDLLSADYSNTHAQSHTAQYCKIWCQVLSDRRKEVDEAQVFFSSDQNEKRVRVYTSSRSYKLLQNSHISLFSRLWTRFTWCDVHVYLKPCIWQCVCNLFRLSVAPNQIEGIIQHIVQKKSADRASASITAKQASTRAAADCASASITDKVVSARKLFVQGNHGTTVH